MTSLDIYLHDFPQNKFSQNQLQYELKQNNIPITLDSYNQQDINLTLYFSGNVADYTTQIMDIIHNHIPKTIDSFNEIIEIFNSSNKTYSTNVYTKVCEFPYKGENIHSILKCELLSYINMENLTYNIRIYDKTNNKIISEKTFSNTTNEICVIDSLINFPFYASILEIHCKINESFINDALLHISSINIYY